MQLNSVRWAEPGQLEPGLEVVAFGGLRGRSLPSFGGFLQNNGFVQQRGDMARHHVLVCVCD